MIAAGKYIIPCNSTDTWRLWALGDIHLGAVGCCKDALQKTIDIIKSDEHAIWIGLGDYIDGHTTKHKHYAAHNIDPSITVAEMGDFAVTMQRQVHSFFAPIKDKCIGLLLGNHEYNFMVKNMNEGWHRDLCKSLNVRDLGYTCVVKIVFKDIDTEKEYAYTVFATHGAGYAVTLGAKKNRLIKFMNDVFLDADIYMMGHVHAAEQHYDLKLSTCADGKEMTTKKRLGVITGTYLQTYSQNNLPSYGERHGYTPTTIGSPAIVITPSSGRVGVEWELQ